MAIIIGPKGHRILKGPEGQEIDLDALLSIDDLIKSRLEPIAKKYGVLVEELIGNYDHWVFKDINQKHIEAVKKNHSYMQKKYEKAGLRFPIITARDIEKLDKKIQEYFP